MKTMLFNPYTGRARHPYDIASDPEGTLMLDPDEPVVAATLTDQLSNPCKPLCELCVKRGYSACAKTAETTSITVEQLPVHSATGLWDCEYAPSPQLIPLTQLTSIPEHSTVVYAKGELTIKASSVDTIDSATDASNPQLDTAVSPSGKFKIGDRVYKVRGAQWRGTIVGWYSTTLTPVGWAVESDTERGSVQIYPESALELI